MADVLLIVPARAGSVGVPRKNTRTVDGVPLVVRTLQTIMAANEILNGAAILQAVVSTDDPVVAELARVYGVTVQARPDRLAGPEATLVDVGRYVANEMMWDGPVGIAQPTAPCLTPATVVDMLGEFMTEEAYLTASTAYPDTGLCWVNVDGEWSVVGAQVNRQYVPATDARVYRETGGLRLWRSVQVMNEHGLFVPDAHYLHDVDEVEAIDVDTPLHVEMARSAQERLRVLFVVEAGDVTGSGHLHRTLALADELAHHEVAVSFATTAPQWAQDALRAGGVRQVAVWDEYSLTDGWDDEHQGAPDVVVFDKLDTDIAEVSACLLAGAAPVSIEDLGPGSALCHATVNELYPVGDLSGPRYAVLRPEFIAPPMPPPRAGTVLLTFGGTDPAGRAHTVGRTLDTLADDPTNVWLNRVTRVRDGQLMAKAMREADVVVTSCGRTVHEAAAIGRPVIAIPANAREEMHVHVPGVIYLGTPYHVPVDELTETLRTLLTKQDLADTLATQLRSAVDAHGARRIADLIQQIGRTA
ncbi:MAG: cytidylyltransferase domain-containing protein [Baekduiaceae bacterium]